MPSRTTPHADSFILQHRPDLHLLVLRWLRPHTLSEVQDTYYQLLSLARQHGCAHWLLDGRRDGLIDLESVHWLTGHFFPEAVRILAPHRLCMAALSSPARLQQSRSDSFMNPIVREALSNKQPYLTQVFLTEAEALTWLGTQPT